MGALFWKYSFTASGSSSLTHPAPLVCSRNSLINSPGLQGSQQGTPRALLHPRLCGGIGPRGRDHGEWKRKMFCQRHLAGSAGEHGHVPAILDLPTAVTSRSGLQRSVGMPRVCSRSSQDSSNCPQRKFRVSDLGSRTWGDTSPPRKNSQPRAMGTISPS